MLLPLFVGISLFPAYAQQIPSHNPHPGAPEPAFVNVNSVDEEVDGSWRHLRGSVHIETNDSLLTADEVDLNDDTKMAYARGHVHYEGYVNGDVIDCDHAEYNIDDETGKFYDIRGTSPSKIQSRPGLLTTSNPFYFQGEWAQRNEDRYFLYDGFITDCKIPQPWWTLTAPKFDIIQNDRALAYRAIFRIRNIPLFYSPVIYKSLKKLPRKSGFLTPSPTHSTIRGYMLRVGYFWAINRSYDLSYAIEYTTLRGTGHEVGFRGKVRPGTEYSLALFGVDDSGLKNSAGQVIQKASGYTLLVDGRSDLGDGWFFRGRLDYLSSFLFRQTFTESFQEAVSSESHSVGYLTKHWSNWAVNVVVQRDENFLDATSPQDKIIIKKLPEVEFLGRERPISNFIIPLYFSLDATAGFLDRSTPYPTAATEVNPAAPTPVWLETRRFVDRLDIYPHLSSALHWLGIDIVPTVALRETEYGSSIANNQVVGADLVRNAREVDLELMPPPLGRVYKAPKWLGNDKLKHVIELRAKYKYITGIGNFNNIIRFDETDLMSDTNEVELMLTNRLYIKNKDGNIAEVLTWELAQSRYFDPTFGGAVIAGQRNVVQSEADLTGFAFLDGPRNYSPISSTLRFQQKVGIDWRTDFDPLYNRITNSTVSVDTRFANYFISAGHTLVNTDPVLTAPSNQFRATLGWGDPNRKGLSAGISAYYDYKRSVLEFATVQMTYNTDCCGISAQYRRLNFGTRDESQIRFAFAISNIGTFGTLKRQERIF